jgi:hypothetical protein
MSGNDSARRRGDGARYRHDEPDRQAIKDRCAGRQRKALERLFTGYVIKFATESEVPAVRRAVPRHSRQRARSPGIEIAQLI